MAKAAGSGDGEDPSGDAGGPLLGGGSSSGSGRDGKGGGPDGGTAGDDGEGPRSPFGGGDDDMASSVKRFVTIFLFILALFVIFDQELRAATGDMAGAVLEPLFAFNHQWPVFTFFPVAVVMVLVTSTLRHVMMDWKEMARVQHVMSHVNKELFRATREENKYKIKKLNEIKESDEFTQMQAQQMSGTWKVMGPTMIIAVAIFAWMFSFAAAPIAFDVQAPSGTVFLAWDGADLHAAGVADGATTSFVAGEAGTVHVFAPPGANAPFGEAGAVRGYDGKAFTGPVLGPLNVSRGRTVDLEPGTYRVQTLPGDSDLRVGDAALDYALVVVNGSAAAGGGGPGPLQVVRVPPVAEGGTAPSFTVAEGETVRILVPVREEPTAGELHVRFTWTVGQETRTRTEQVPADEAWVLEDRPAVTVVSMQGRVPWAEFDLNGTTLLPNWILLYSLFTIPFGYLFQKVFKALSYHGELEEADAQRTAGGGGGGGAPPS